ncbi:MAG: B12-binding domain-containing radical SAM protein [Candidatus Margulisiibacteriota bacterium]
MSLTIGKSRISVLLVNYAGYPASLSSLMPDNGLASLASSLRSAGHRVRILDYATVSMMRRLVPERVHEKLSNILKEFEDVSPNSTSFRTKIKQIKGFLQLKLVARELEKVRKDEEVKIAEEISKMVEEQKVDLVGFKLWNGDGFSGPVIMAEILKKRFPGLLVVAGGPQVKFFRDQIFSLTKGFDILAIGDGEATILPLVEVAKGRNIEEVPNIFFLNNRGISQFTRFEQIADMNSLPFPVYDSEIYPAMEGDEKIKLLVVEDRRGCENLCRFCVHPFISGPKPRSKSPERVADEFQFGFQQYGISAFRLGGSSSSAELLLGLAKNLEKKDLHVNWTAFARIKDSKVDAFEYLKQQGLFGLFFGIESGSQKVLEGMNKKVSVEKIKEVILAAKNAGIFTVGSIIYPAPFDTPQTREETLKLLLEIRPDAVPLQFLGIYPGTEYAKYPEKYNLEIIYPSWFSNLLARIGLKKKPRFDDPEVLRYLIQYKINLLFPPKFWRPLPWKINGMGHRQFAAETQKLYEDLKSNGVVTMLTDEEALMAHLAGYSPREFMSEAFVNVFTGNWMRTSEMVAKINRGIIK